MIRNRLNKYSATRGEICYPKYISITNAREYLFFLKADTNKLQQICDRWFNGPSNRGLQIKPASNQVIAKIIDCSCNSGTNCTHDERESTSCASSECRISSILNDYQEPIGRLMYSSLEFSFFVENENGEIFLCSPFRYNDNGIVMVNERELLGFPTAFCEVGRYELNGEKHQFELHKPTQYFSEESKDSLQFTAMMNFDFPEEDMLTNEFAAGGLDVVPEVLLDLSRNETSKEANFTRLDGPDVRDHVRQMLVENSDELDSVDVLADLLTDRRQYLSLIQFRDIELTDQAMVQTIFDIQASNVSILGGEKTEARFDLILDFWRQNSINKKQKLKALRDSSGYNADAMVVEEVIESYEIAECFGFESLVNIPCCSIDVDLTLASNRLYWDNKVRS